jgi:hypothetical protein
MLGEVSAMEANKKPWEERLSEAGARVEEEVRRVVRFIDDEVVPDVRRNSSTALKAAAEKLAKLAQHLDDNANKAGKP